MRCHKRTAQKYISIATNEALSEAASAPLLPVDFVILYELSRIDKEGLSVAFSEGWITPFTRI